MPHARRLADTGPALSRAARVRLAWMDYYRSHGQNAALTCRHFGISRQTFYRWKRRYDPDRLASLEARGRRPRRLRQPTLGTGARPRGAPRPGAVPPVGQGQAGRGARRAGWTVSTSMVGRILAKLKARGVLREAPRAAISTRKRAFRRPYAVRKPKGYAVDQPGDLVQVDTLDVRPVPGVACSNTSPPATSSPAGTCWKPAPALQPPRHPRASSTGSWPACLSPSAPSRWTAAPSSRLSLRRPARHAASASSSCPRARPKLNGCVERAQRTHTEEFYEVTPFSLEIAALNRELLALGARLQHRPAARGPRLSHPGPSSSTDGKLSERRPSVTNVPHEYEFFARIWTAVIGCLLEGGN